MCLKSIRLLERFFSWNFTGWGKPAAAAGPKFYTYLLFFGIALVFSITIIGETFASEHPEKANYENLDPRWLPWIGSWRLVSNKVNTKESFSKEEYLLTISPGSNRNSVIMKGIRGDKVLLQEEIIADGLRHPLKEEKCTGYYSYSWSETGKRLLLNTESDCPGDPPRRISGMSIFDEGGEWLDIQLLQSGEEKAVSIRKYRSVDSDSVTSPRFNPTRNSILRIAAGKNFSISEIIELSSKVKPEVLEAALLAIRKPFPINSKQLIRLSDAGVNSRIVDLMVALSFPDKFTVKQETISLAQAAGPRSNYPFFRMPYHYYYYDYPFLPWHWASWTYMSYGYSYLGWYTDGYYYPLWSYYQPIYEGGGGGGGARHNGNLINGQGYKRTNSGSSGSSPRRARPRNAPAAQRAPVRASSSSSSGMSSSYSGGSSGSSSSPTTSGSSGGSPSASPNGYGSGH